MDQLRVFLSHSSQDKSVADQFAQALRKAGADVWYDEQNLGPGHLRRTIMKELGERPIFVVLLSPAALESDWVLDECEWAYDLQRIDATRVLLPVLIEQLNSSHLNAALYLRSFKRVEAGELRPLALSDAIEQTLSLLDVSASSPQNPSQESQTTGPSSQEAEKLIQDGRVLLTIGESPNAAILLEQVVQHYPSNSRAWFDLGLAYANLGRWSEMLRANERASELDPTNKYAWFNRGLALHRLGRNADAVTSYDRALSLDPLFLEAWSSKGTALSLLYRYHESLASFERALYLDKTWLKGWIGKAYVLRALGREGEAQEAEEQVKNLGG